MSKSKKVGSPPRILAKSLAHAKIPTFLVDPKGNIAFANAQMADWARVPLDQLLGLSCRTPLPDDSSVHRSLTALLATPRSDRTQSRVIERPTDPANPQGGSSTFRCLTIPLNDSEEGWTLHFIQSHSELNHPEHFAKVDAESLESRQQAFRAIAQIRSQFSQLDGLRAVIGKSPSATRTLLQIQNSIACDASVVIFGPEGSGRSEVAKAIFAGRLKRIDPAGSSQLFPVECRLMDATLLSNIFEMVDDAAPRGSVPVHQGLLLQSIELLPSEAHQVLDEFLQQKPASTLFTTTKFRDLRTCHPTSQVWNRILSRLDIVRVEVVGIQDRIEDIPLLAEVAIQRLSKAKPRSTSVKLSPQALTYLQAYSWPGSSDEFFRTIETAYDACNGVIELNHLPVAIRTFPSFIESQHQTSETINLDGMLESIERSLLQRAVDLHPNNRAMAARFLGISRTRLLRRLEQLQITSQAIENTLQDRNEVGEPIADSNFSVESKFDQPTEKDSSNIADERSDNTPSNSIPSSEPEELIEFIEIKEESASPPTLPKTKNRKTDR